jgi:PAS domain S-box-containing protein
MRDGYIRNLEIDYVNTSGTIVPIEINATVLRSGDAMQILTLCRDITERKRTGEAVRESEKRYRTLFEQNSYLIFVADPKTRMITDCNLNAEQMTGYSRAELLSLPIDALHPEDVRAATLDNFMKIKDGMDISIDSIVITRDNRRVPVLITGGPVVVNRQLLLLGSFRDMTHQKLAEDAFVRVNQKLNVIYQLTRKELTSQIFVLNGYFEMAKSYSAGQDRIIETLKKGEQSIQSIHKTIEYSKDYQDMGAKPPKWQNVKRAMLFGISHIFIGKIQHRLETDNLEIFADPLLEKAYQHLFESSLAHGGHVTLIRVWYSITPDGVNLVFEDDGIGIPMENKEGIFIHSEGSSGTVLDKTA